jgi:parvulin-like peptidyl-prolyl isomerase
MALLVNGDYIDEDAIGQESELIRQRLSQEMPGETELSIGMTAREWATDNVIERVLLQQQAAQRYAEAPDDTRLEKLLEHVTNGVAKPKKKEVGEFYQTNEALFATPECAHASHIVKNIDEQTSEDAAREAIEKAEAELRSGRPFAEVADQYSDCAGAGGELGWFPRGEMVDEFETALFALHPGEVSGIFRTPFGFHIAALHERKPAGVRPLADVYAQVEGMILTSRKQEALERFLDELRGQAEIRRVPARKPDGAE